MSTPTVTSTPDGAQILAGYGLTARIDGAWEGRLFLRPQPEPASPTKGVARPQANADGNPGERTFPVLHLADFPLPAVRGDFGSGALDSLTSRHAFVSLLEYGPEEAGTPLFAPTGLPRPTAAEFSPNTLQQHRPGQVGYQRFFTAAGRAFCLFVVLGAAGATESAGRVRSLLDGVEIS